VQTYKIIKPDADAICLEAAKDFLRLAQQCVQQKGEFSVALAGGSTPKKLYQILAKPPYADALPWGKMRLFFGDERGVPPDHPDSNYAMANRYLFKHINIDPTHVHRVQAELEPDKAAQAYHATLKGFLPLDEDNRPVFDLVLLGLGADGHVASLFPGTDILQVEDRCAAAVWVEDKNSWRISVTLPVINSAEHVWLLVTGEAKNDIVDRVFHYPSVNTPLPVERLNPKRDLSWYLDHAAARWVR
jgi:6-phosphogluconolactonase